MGNILRRPPRNGESVTPTSVTPSPPAQNTNPIDKSDPLWKLSAPNGLYPKCAWDRTKVYRMIVNKQLAPRHKGLDSEKLPECLICYLNYETVNSLTCCKHSICSECFLQIKSPTDPEKNRCPFCNRPELSVSIHKPKTPKTPKSKPSSRVSSLKKKAGLKSVKSNPPDSQQSSGVVQEPEQAVKPKSIDSRTDSSCVLSPTPVDGVTLAASDTEPQPIPSPLAPERTVSEPCIPRIHPEKPPLQQSKSLYDILTSELETGKAIVRPSSTAPKLSSSTYVAPRDPKFFQKSRSSSLVVTPNPASMAPTPVNIRFMGQMAISALETYPQLNTLLDPRLLKRIRSRRATFDDLMMLEAIRRSLVSAPQASSSSATSSSTDPKQ